jgi:hypothetical protein
VTAEIQEKTKTVRLYEVRCPDCDGLYITEERNIGSAQRAQARHDQFAHSEPPIAHYIRWSDHRGILGGWAVECICGYRTNTDDDYAWRCPLDRSGT